MFETPLLPPLSVVVSPHEPTASHLVGSDLLAREIGLVAAVVGSCERPLANDSPQLGIRLGEFGTVGTRVGVMLGARPVLHIR
jgi:hypothetical protein